MARPCHHSKSPVYKHTSCIKGSKRNLEGPVKVQLLKWKLNLSLVRFLGKSWQLFLLGNVVPGCEFFSAYEDTVHREKANCSLPLTSTRIVLPKGDLLSFHAIWEMWREKKTQSQTLTVLKILQTQEWLLHFFTCYPLIFNLHMDKMSAELSRNIWMLWYLTNLIGTANEPEDGECIMWLLLQPSPNEYK